ncbi:MAG: hypothetical protein P4L61_01435 [Candidatus Pacebacteria bacterium]|nr:hypothetical protein [Candidatus Paceibacterota bacterium]
MIIIVVQVFSSTTAQAQTTTDVTKATYTLLAPLPELGGACPTGSGTTCGSDSNGGTGITKIDLTDYISYAYKLMLALAVFLAVLMIIVGGFEYMLSGAADTKSDAKKRISNAIWGLLLALIAYIVLYTIDPNLVSTSNLSIPPISSTSTTATSASAGSSAGSSAVAPGSVSGAAGSVGGNGSGGGGGGTGF